MKKVIFCLLLSMTSMLSCEDIGSADKDQFMYEDWLKIVEITEQMQTRSDVIERVNRAIIDSTEIAEDLGDLREFYGDECKSSAEFKDLFLKFVAYYVEMQKLEEEVNSLPEKQQIKDVLLKYTDVTI